MATLNNYNGYLKPWLREIDKMEQANFPLREQARILYNLGVVPPGIQDTITRDRAGFNGQPHSKEEWDKLDKWKRDNSLTAIYGSLVNVRGKKRGPAPINTKGPWQQVWTPEKQYLEIEMERL